MSELVSKDCKVCFILDHRLMHYRVSFFEQLVARGYKVYVMHTGKVLEGKHSFSQVRVGFKKFWGMEYRKLPNLSSFDIVVHMQNLRILNLWLLTLNPFKTYKVIHWGIGTSSAKGLSSRKSISSFLRNFLAKFSSAQILYSSFPLELFSKKVRAKTFIANNTIENLFAADFSNSPKDSVLFIGTLNHRKGVDVLIRAFLKYLDDYGPKQIKVLNIIGDGPMKEELYRIAKSSPCGSSVVFVGNVEDDVRKQKYFQTAAICISPNQAGLSILESFSYGVPFLAFNNCISGGEHFNITNGVNGYLINQEDEIVDILGNLDNTSEQARFLGRNAFEYYHRNRRMSHMVDSFANVFDLVSKKAI